MKFIYLRRVVQKEGKTMQNNKLVKLIRFIYDRDYRFLHFSQLGKYNTMDDAEYLRRLYRSRMGIDLNLENPTRYTEKLQWLKLYDRKPEYTVMVDKYAVKSYVAKKIGHSYIIPTLGVWERFEDIDFDKLPNQFVLKCTHDSGGLVICRDKSVLDMEAAARKIRASLKRNYYYSSREWPYKNVKPRIIAEKYIEDHNSSGLRDYKFFCFNGKVEFLYLSEGLENHQTARISFVSLDWKPMWFSRDDYKEFEVLPPKPHNFELMIELAEKLSSGFPHLRVDFYEVENQVLFGELTFFNGSGFTRFNPIKADYEIGKLIKLPTN